MKRLLAAALVFIMLLAIIAPVIADSNYSDAGKVLADLGLLKGDDNGNLRLNENLKRQDMVVMISRLYGEESEARTSTKENVFKDLTPERKFYIPYIAWARDKGLIVGMENNEFGFHREVTVQEFQTVLLRVLDYGEEASVWNDVPELAKKMGIMKDLSLSPSKKLTRGELAAMVLNTLRENKKGGSILTLGEILGLKIPESLNVNEKVTIDLNTITFEGKAKDIKDLKLYLRPTSSGISGGAKSIDIKDLDDEGNFKIVVKDLEAGSYEYRFESSKGETKFKSVEIEKVSFQLLDVKAENLKEISLRFTQAVDTQTASFISNYSTTAGTIKDIRFKDNNREVILILNGTMSQNSKHKVSSHRLRSYDGQELSINNEEFTASDRDMPRVEEIIQLGNQGLRIVFSEPIRSISPRNFQINGRNIMADVKLDNHTVFLEYYSSSYALDEGEHVLTLTGIEDFAGYKAIDEDISFNIINDKTPPTVVGQSATLDQVLIEFDEDIDPKTSSKNNFYWKSGNVKRHPDNVKFVNNKAYLDFTKHRLSADETTIYVENVADYSGNKMRLTEVKVLPVIDKTSPEVLSYKVAEDGRSITVFYSKNVNGRTKSNYFIEDENGKTVYIRDVQGSDREFTILLSSPLPIGINTLYIDNVEDTTPLKNLLIPFEARIDMKDVERPKVEHYTGYGNYIMMKFSKEMDMDTLMNHENYYIDFDGSVLRLPTESYIKADNDRQSITIELPESINGKKVVLGSNIRFMEMRDLKDLTGNDTNPLLLRLDFDRDSSGNAQAVDYDKNFPGKKAALVEEDMVKIKFNIPIVEASVRDFSIRNRTIEDVKVDGSNEVTLYLRDYDQTSISGGEVEILRNNDIRTSIDSGVKAETLQVLDLVAPRVLDGIEELNIINRDTIELPFTEELDEEGVSLYRMDLEIIREEDGKVLSTDEFTTSLGYTKSVLNIRIKNRDKTSRYTLRISGNPRNNAGPTYIRDKQGNLVSESDLYITDVIYK